MLARLLEGFSCFLWLNLSNVVKPSLWLGFDILDFSYLSIAVADDFINLKFDFCFSKSNILYVLF